MAYVHAISFSKTKGIQLSNTDNTRPFEVLVKDPTVKRIMIDHGQPGETDYEDPQYMPVYYGGINSHGRNAKPERKLIRRKIRAAERQFLHRLLFGYDLEETVPPLIAEKRSVGWVLS